MSAELPKMPEPDDASLIALAEKCGAEQCGLTGEYLGFSSVDQIRAFWKEATRQAMERYNELLFAVGRKYPGQTRHETALMYIKRAEESTEVSALLPNEEKRHG